MDSRFTAPGGSTSGTTARCRAEQGGDRAQHGEAQVKIWRRSYDIPPPPLDPGRPAPPLARSALRRALTGRAAADRIAEGHGRAVPALLARAIAPEISAESACSIAAHGNSLRALVKYLDDMSDEEIVELNIPTGIPLVYVLNDDLEPLQKFYLGDSRGGDKKRGGGRG